MIYKITTDIIENTKTFSKLSGFEKKIYLMKNNRFTLEKSLIHYKINNNNVYKG